MTNPKKLSLQEEIQREVEQIEKEIAEQPELNRLEVTEEMDAALLAKIQAYEREKANTEFSEELAPDLSGFRERTAYSAVAPEKPADAGETKTVRRKKRNIRWIAVLAAVLVLVLGIGSTSVGSKSYWKELWDRILGDGSAKVINVEDMDRQDTESFDEIRIYKEIAEKLGISSVRMSYKPEQMVLVDYEIDEEMEQARLFYNYDGEVIRYTFYANRKDSSSGIKEGDQKINEYSLSVNDVEIFVEEYQKPEETVSRMLAHFEYQGSYYELKGVLEGEELEKILKNLFFSKKA